MLSLLLPLPALHPAWALPHAPRLAAPARSPVRLALTYPEYVKAKEIKDAGQNGTQATFGASSSLIDATPELINMAREAAEKAGHAEKFSASQIVLAFNAWKLSSGTTYENKEEASKALRAFAADLQLITSNLEAAESVLFNSDFNPFADDELTAYLNSEWHSAWKQASDSRASAEAQKAKALAGQAAAQDKLRQAVALASQNEKSIIAAAEAQYSKAMREAEEVAGQERARLALALAQVAADEKEAREAALKQLTNAKKDAAVKAASSVATAQADREGALHMFKQMEEQATSSLEAADMELKQALKWAQEQEEAARKAAAKKASLIVTAQSEAKALLELLKQSKQEAAAAAAKMEEEKLEMEKAVELANKRVRKAKLAAAAALEDL
ncbi:hypothetical protein AB1Y20_021987 [Prymnesium parvum]|uniref:Uncharacterized protein n=1 Tax=Prymnesium parvum TaxID=97485 RepID=A0AB34JF12_PRYPA